MNLDFNEICRLCLRFCEKYVDLNQKNGVKSLANELAEKINFCYLIPMDLSEGLPTKVCYECIQVISFFYIAKKNVLISEHLLRDVLYVRKKLQAEAMINKEESVTGPELIKIKSEKQKPSQSFLAVNTKPHNNLYNVELNYNKFRLSNTTSSLNFKKDPSVPSNCNSRIAVNCRQNGDFKVKKKKKLKYDQSYKDQNNELAKLFNKQNNKSDASLKFTDLKKLRCQPKRKLKSVKVNATEKEAPKNERPLEEYVVKEIGTVIDTSNILSPDVKRTRKSVLAR